MKRFCLILAILCLLPFGLKAEEKAPFYLVMAGSVVGADDFQNVSGALQIGTSISVDADKGLMLRTLYTKAHWGKVDFQAVRFAPLLSWYAGKRWDFYVIGGGEAWQAESESGTNFFVGLGATRRIYTSTTAGYTVPFMIDFFADFTSDNTGSPYENISQITFGLQFSKPVKK